MVQYVVCRSLFAYPLSVSDSFACLLQQMVIRSRWRRRRRRRFNAPDWGVANDQLWTTSIDAVRVVIVPSWSTAVVKDAVRLVRLVEGKVDECVGDFAQAPPTGPGRLARHFPSTTTTTTTATARWRCRCWQCRIGRRFVQFLVVLVVVTVPTFASVPFRWQSHSSQVVAVIAAVVVTVRCCCTRLGRRRFVVRRVTQTVGATPPRRPYEQSKFRHFWCFSRLLLLLLLLLFIAILIGQFSRPPHHVPQLGTGRFANLHQRMMHYSFFKCSLSTTRTYTRTPLTPTT